MAEVQTITWAAALASDSEPTFNAGVVQTIMIHDQVTPFVPVVAFSGEKLEWVKEKSLGEDSADFEGSDDALVAQVDQAIHQVGCEWEKVSTRPCEFAAYFGVASRTVRELSQIFPLMDATRESANKRIWNAFLRRCWLPGGSIANTENRFDTLPDLLDAEVFNPHRREANRLSSGKQQTHYGVEEVTGVGGFGIKNMDEMRLWLDGNCELFAMHSDDILAYEEILRERGNGGMTPYEGFEVPGTNDVVNFPTYKGIPLMRVDFIPVEGDGYGEWATTRRFYAMNLSGQYSVRGLTSLGNSVVRIPVAREKDMLKDYEQLVLNANLIVPSLYTYAQCIHEIPA